MNTRTWPRRALPSIAVVWAVLAPLEAAANTWQGGADRYWTNAANWSAVAVPADGEDVIIPNTANQPIMDAGVYPAAGAFNTFEVQGSAIVTCKGATNVVNGGTVAIPYGTGVAIRCQSALITGTLSADGQGFPLARGPGYVINVTFGGSHGGRAGNDSVGKTYSSLREPTALGSGGNNSAGGGAIRLIATGMVTVNGTITANAQVSGANYGGSGGSLWITAATLVGKGTISATGAARGGNPSQGGGGGGRVALDYGSSTFTGLVSVAGGKGCTPTYGYSDGQAGTLWEPKRFENVIGTSESPTNVWVRGGFQYYFTNNVVRYWNLTVTNAWFEVHDGAMEIRKLTLNKSTFNFDDYVNGRRGVVDMESIGIGGDIALTGDSDLFLPPGDYAFGALSVEKDATVYLMGNTNAVNGGTVGNPYGTGVTIRCQSATIHGALEADRHGFSKAKGPGFVPTIAASHGGRAGSDTVNKTYGSVVEPTALGSGSYGNSGGGAIRLVVSGALALNGIITAEGGVPWLSHTGESGGSVWVTAQTLAGGGTIRARGASRSSNPSWPGGGGGRIAIWYGSSTFTGTVTAAGGVGAVQPTYALSDGRTGTVFMCRSVCPGASATGCDGVKLASRFTSAGSIDNATNGLRITRIISKWIVDRPRLEWTDSLLDGNPNDLDSTVTYTITGLAPNRRLFVHHNDELVYNLDTGAGGELVFDMAVDGAAHQIVVAPAPGGTLVLIH